MVAKREASPAEDEKKKSVEVRVPVSELRRLDLEAAHRGVGKGRVLLDAWRRLQAADG